jgi:hypothetical protein
MATVTTNWSTVFSAPQIKAQASRRHLYYHPATVQADPDNTGNIHVRPVNQTTYIVLPPGGTMRYDLQTILDGVEAKAVTGTETVNVSIGELAYANDKIESITAVVEVEIPPVVSTLNSSATPLAAGATFTGTAEAINGYGIIYVNVYSDVASATDGLHIDQSSDGTNWDHCDEFTIPAATGKNFSINPYAKWLRVRYINGGTEQTAFRLQTILKNTGKSSSHRIADAIISDDDAELVKSVLTGIGPDDVFRNVMTTVDGDLTISDNSSGLAIAKGDVTGVVSDHKFGNAPDFDTGDGEVTVWDGANDADTPNAMVYTFSATADIDTISSSDGTDTQSVEIIGLDGDGNLVTQTKTLTGQTKATLDTPLWRVFRMKNLGATDFAGYIYCYVDTAIVNGKPTDQTKIRAVVDDGNNQTEMAVYTVPNGKTCYVRSVYASTAGGSRATNYVIKLKARPFGGVFQLKHRRSINDDKDLDKTFEDPQVFAAKTDLVMTADIVASAITGGNVSAGFDFVLVDD